MRVRPPTSDGKPAPVLRKVRTCATYRTTGETMKRHDALIAFSHDHQNALARALRLRKAADLDQDGKRAGAAAYLEFVDDRISPHFAEEEAMLDRACEASDLESVRDLQQQLQLQHEQLKTGFEDLRRQLEAGNELDRDLLHDTGQALTDHIRFEERELFEQLQRDLPDDVLRAIAAPATDHDD